MWIALIFGYGYLAAALAWAESGTLVGSKDDASCEFVSRDSVSGGMTPKINVPATESPMAMPSGRLLAAAGAVSVATGSAPYGRASDTGRRNIDATIRR